MATTYVIAEVGVNHNGDLGLAERLVAAAAAAGADAVKFQTFDAEALATSGAQKADYQCRLDGNDRSQLEMLKALELPTDAHPVLMALCASLGIEFLSTPFDPGSARLLAALGIGRFKIPSGEVTNLPFLRLVASFGRPVILSTGMSDLAEVATAVDALKESGCRDLAILHCVSDYPARPEDANLRAMGTLATAFGLPVGLSDHTPGIEVALAAVALGATIVEKHLTLDRRLAGPDHAASLEPLEFQALVRGIRIVESALGSGEKRARPREMALRPLVRKSLVAARDIPAGSVLTDADIAAKRPGTGMPPAAGASLVGRTALVAIAKDAFLAEEMFT